MSTRASSSGRMAPGACARVTPTATGGRCLRGRGRRGDPGPGSGWLGGRRVCGPGPGVSRTVAAEADPGGRRGGHRGGTGRRRCRSRRRRGGIRGGGRIGRARQVARGLLRWRAGVCGGSGWRCGCCRCWTWACLGCGGVVEAAGGRPRTVGFPLREARGGYSRRSLRRLRW